MTARAVSKALWWRLHWTTILAFPLVAAPIVLANLVEAEESVSVPAPGGASIGGYANTRANQYGWPWPWVWMDVEAPGPSFDSQTCTWNAMPLAGNIGVLIGAVLVTGIVGQWLHRRFWTRNRFNLRAMLFLTALIAAALGWYVSADRRIKREDALAKRIEPNATVYREYWGPRWTRVLGLHRHCSRAVGVDVYEPGEMGWQDTFAETMLQLGGLPSLRTVDMGATRQFDQPELLGNVRSIESLALNVPHISEELVDAFVAMPRLRKLTLATMDDSEAQGRQLRRLAHIENLGLTGIDLSVLDELGELPRLRELRLRRVAKAPPPSSVRRFERLETLRLFSCHIDANLARWLASMPGLHKLDLRCVIADAAALTILAQCKSLSEVDFPAHWNEVDYNDKNWRTAYQRLRKATSDCVWSEIEVVDCAPQALDVYDYEDWLLAAREICDGTRYGGMWARIVNY